MTSPQAGAEQAIAALFAERQRYEGWLTALEGKRGATPPHVLERVQADYGARLQRVVEQIRGHRAVIQGWLNEHDDRLTELDIEEAKQKDEQAEAELRAAVGEFTNEQYDQAVRRCEAAIAAVDADRGKVSAEMARLRGMLEDSPLATPPRGVAHPPPPKAPPTPQAVPPGSSPQARASSDSSFDELQFLKSVVESPSGEHAAVGAGAVNVAAAPDAGRRSDSVTTPSTDLADLDSRTPDGVREVTPAFFKEAPPEQVKSLKCQECGTLNYPTEWYCERCGAELAAL